MADKPQPRTKKCTHRVKQNQWKKRSRKHVCLFGTEMDPSSIRSKVIWGGGQKFRNWSRDPGHAHLWVVLYFIRRGVRPPSLYQIWSGLLNSFNSY